MIILNNIPTSESRKEFLQDCRKIKTKHSTYTYMQIVKWSNNCLQ